MTSFSLFLGVQSAPEVGPTSYETPCIICIRVYACMYVFGTSYVIDYLQRYFASNSYRERFPTRIPAIDTNGPREFTLLRVIYNVYTMNLELKFIH